MDDITLKFKFGNLQTFKNMSILPLFLNIKSSPEYISLEEALRQGLLTITEANHAGSVPELKVINRSPQSILMLHGEELIGAKQNRVLNTSILLEGYATVVIPVSCTEQGRWNYTSAEFAYSGVIMPYGVRANKVRGVTGSLHAKQGFSSNQAQIWSDIDRIDQGTGTLSSTGALRDSYTARADELDEYLQAFECVPRQQGSIVFINGDAVGLDVFSREETYCSLHPKLIKSCALDALLQRKERFDTPTRSKAKTLLKEARTCTKSKFDSVSQGFDYRLEGENVVGSALVVENTLIHFSFFKLPKNEQSFRTRGILQRRRY